MNFYPCIAHVLSDLRTVWYKASEQLWNSRRLEQWNPKFIPCMSNNLQLYTVYLYLEPVLHVSLSTVGSSNGVTNTRCCRYNSMRSWWWVKVPPKNAEQFPDVNKLCASCRTYTGIYLRCTDPWTSNPKLTYGSKWNFARILSNWDKIQYKGSEHNVASSNSV
jgi:hypothetical protein